MEDDRYGLQEEMWIRSVAGQRLNAFLVPAIGA
jgi:hypothetical protein